MGAGCRSASHEGRVFLTQRQFLVHRNAGPRAWKAGPRGREGRIASADRRPAARSPHDFSSRLRPRRPAARPGPSVAPVAGPRGALRLLRHALPGGVVRRPHPCGHGLPRGRVRHGRAAGRSGGRAGGSGGRRGPAGPGRLSGGPPARLHDLVRVRAGPGARRGRAVRAAAGSGALAPDADAEAALEALTRQGVALGVVSDVGWDLRATFTHHGLDRYFSVWVHSYEHSTEKPDPALFEYACRQLAVAPAETLMVGDHPAKDGGAAGSGLRSYVLPAGAAPGAVRGLDAVLRLVRPAAL
ncbi:HAD family hydrolase [Streptomyces sp. NPDC053560]|uniref:HAD family hydrolase n=1 Tax=Streptomyces sp. NPDC053560 TaxID=3365711 RepID=UPI0037D83E27